MNNVQNLLNTVTEIAQSEEFEQFQVNARDFMSAREQGQSPGTQISQMTASLSDAAEILNRSFAKTEEDGRYTNVISPVVIPKEIRSYMWLLWAFLGLLFGLFGSTVSSGLDSLVGTRASLVFFGPHYWLIWLAYVGFSIWRNSFVEIPDGCQALITKFGKVESVVGAGRTRLLDPRRKVSYIVNTTKEYPYNAPIRQAPTSGRIDASVDLFLQFKIEEPSEFIFTLGGVNGFSEKLHNAISEVTRALIYEQKAEEIYDLVGESTQGLLETLNNQFQPAVKFVNANITHAEPASQEYRMDLAAAEIVRVAKEAYNYQYELKLRKEQDEGELNKELAALKETLSEIKADIARYQAQITIAREKEVNRANAYARQLMVEAESEAKANAALLDAQALDIRAISSAYYPEILQYRYQQDVLAKVESVAENLPQIVNVGDGESRIDYMAIAQQMLGIEDTTLFSDEEIQNIRQRMKAIVARIRERAAEIDEALTADNGHSAQEAALAVAPDDVLQELDDDENGRQAEEVK
ncbi:MAG: SPFH domain-containing protein [Chloroflexi bacterium]|nr:SPFH domain-containing protein [Chloroflexota bacterium]